MTDETNKIQEEFIQLVASLLGVGQRTVLNLIGANSYMSRDEQKNREIRLKATLLTYIVTLYVKKRVIPEVIYEILTTPVFPNIQGHMNSVSTAIQFESYELETLVNIAEIAYTQIQDTHIKEDHLSRLEKMIEVLIKEKDERI